MKKTEFLMAREKKKRMMPRHLLTAAVLLGIIPDNMVSKDSVMKAEEIKQLEAHLTPKRPRP